MRRNAVWGGNMEIQAAALKFVVNIHLYQLDSPRWDIINFQDPRVKVIKLSYPAKLFLFAASLTNASITMAIITQVYDL